MLFRALLFSPLRASLHTGANDHLMAGKALGNERHNILQAPQGANMERE